MNRDVFFVGVATFVVGFILTFVLCLTVIVIQSEKISCPEGSTPINGRCLVEIKPS